MNTQAPQVDSSFGKGHLVHMPGAVGMHARPAARLAKLVKGFDAELLLATDKGSADGKSIPKMLSLGIRGGESIWLFTRGAAAEALLAAVLAAFEEGLGELEAAGTGDSNTSKASNPATDLPKPPSLSNKERALTGVVASEGYTIGHLHHLEETSEQRLPSRDFVDVITDTGVLNTAIEKVKQHLATQAKSFDEKDPRHDIFDMHVSLLEDEEMLARARSAIASRNNAAEAWKAAFTESAQALESLANPLMKERSIDVRDVGMQVLRAILSVPEPLSLSKLPAGTALCATDLTPSQTAGLNPENVVALLTTKGGRTSHTAIIARSLGIPALVGLSKALFNAPEKTEVIVDGVNGALYLSPPQEDLEKAKIFMQSIADIKAANWKGRMERGALKSGEFIEVCANIGHIEDAAGLPEKGAEGIGLVRSEFLFSAPEAPSEDSQYESYCKLLEYMGDLPVIVRTLDIGADKHVPYLQMEKEENPMMGVRGIRLSMAEEKFLFVPQIRALLRAGASGKGKLRIMLPMISRVNELREAKAIIERERAALSVPPVPLGVMIEVPAAAMMARELAKEVDFFSVGTNDLSSYTLAMDRMNPSVARNVEPLSPAVLRLIKMAADAAKEAGIWIGVCGGMAANKLGAKILAGLGITELSMEAVAVPDVKATLRTVSKAEVEALAAKALSMSSAREVRQLT